MQVITQTMHFPENRLRIISPHSNILTKSKLKIHFGINYYFREARLRYFFSDSTWLGIGKEAMKYFLHDLRYCTIPTLMFLFCARVYIYDDKNLEPITFEQGAEGLAVWVSRQAMIGGVMAKHLDDSIDYDFARGIQEVKNRVWATSKTPKFRDLRKALTNAREINSKINLLNPRKFENLHLREFTIAEINHGKLITLSDELQPLTREQFSLGRSWPCDIAVNFNNKMYLANSWTAKHLEEAIFLGTSQSWYHFIVEYLPRYLFIPKNLRSTSTVIPSATHKQFIELLENIGFRNLVKTDIFETVHVEKLTTVLDYRFSEPFDFLARKSDLLMLQSFFSQIAMTNNAQSSPDRILIMRPNTTFRRMLNSIDLCHSLSRLGFKVIYPEKMSFTKQVQYFRNASIIVGQSGAALTSLIFSQPKSKIIELGDWEESRQEFFWRDYAKALNLEITSIPARQKSLSNRMSDSFECDISRVLHEITLE